MNVLGGRGDPRSPRFCWSRFRTNKPGKIRLVPRSSDRHPASPATVGRFYRTLRIGESPVSSLPILSPIGTARGTRMAASHTTSPAGFAGRAGCAGNTGEKGCRDHDGSQDDFADCILDTENRVRARLRSRKRQNEANIGLTEVVFSHELTFDQFGFSCAKRSQFGAVVTSRSSWMLALPWTMIEPSFRRREASCSCREFVQWKNVQPAGSPARVASSWVVARGSGWRSRCWSSVPG